MNTPNENTAIPGAPEDFLASLASSYSRGNLRRFLEETLLPPVGEVEQKTAGEAAAAAAVAQMFGLELDDFTSGIESVSGAFDAAGSTRISLPNPDIPEDVGSAAFFDVDNTLIQGASLIVFATGLAKKRYFKLREILPVVWKQTKFRLTGFENAEDVAEGRQQALEFIKGRPVEELVSLCEEIMDTHMSDKIWPGTRALAEKHIAAGQQVWLVSATPVQLAQILARKLGFTGALGTVAEVENGKFTGRLVGDILHGAGKRHAVAALAAVENLDLQRCAAYSDSINDIHMLSMVGTPVAINPDSKLRKEAVRRGWDIRDYRSIRKAVRTFGLPALITAAFGWKFFHRNT